ncbi:Uncharacterised protein [uncultured archaeon]|nr:Uncharacterised protein [uncultured archaeon]
MGDEIKGPHLEGLGLKGYQPTSQNTTSQKPPEDEKPKMSKTDKIFYGVFFGLGVLVLAGFLSTCFSKKDGLQVQNQTANNKDTSNVGAKDVMKEVGDKLAEFNRSIQDYKRTSAQKVSFSKVKITVAKDLGRKVQYLVRPGGEVCGATGQPKNFRKYSEFINSIDTSLFSYVRFESADSLTIQRTVSPSLDSALASYCQKTGLLPLYWADCDGKISRFVIVDPASKTVVPKEKFEEVRRIIEAYGERVALLESGDKAKLKILYERQKQFARNTKMPVNTKGYRLTA